MNRLILLLLLALVTVPAASQNTVAPFRVRELSVGLSSAANNAKLHRGVTALQIVAGSDSTADGVDATSFKPLTASPIVADGTTDIIQLRIQGHSTQTTDILVAEKSDGTDVFHVDNSGRAAVGNATAIQAFTGLTVGATTDNTSGAELALVSTDNASGQSILNFGDTDSRTIGRVKYNHNNNSMELVTNAATALRIDNAGASTIGPAVTNNYTGQRHIISGALYSGNVTSTVSSGQLAIGDNVRFGSQTAQTGRTDTTTGGGGILLDNNTNDALSSITMYVNQAGDATSATADAAITITQAGDVNLQMATGSLTISSVGATGGNVPHACSRRTKDCIGATTCTSDTTNGCNAGEIATGGGCDTSGAFTIVRAYLDSSNQFHCQISSSTNITVTVMCCDY